jgi:hypothetical protein
MPSLTVYLRQLCLSACAIIDCLLALSLTVYPRQLCLSARTIIEYLLPLSLTACPQRHCLPAYSRCRCLPVGPRRYFLHARDVTSCMPAASLPACLPATSLPACPPATLLSAWLRAQGHDSHPVEACKPQALQYCIYILQNTQSGYIQLTDSKSGATLLVERQGPWFKSRSGLSLALIEGPLSVYRLLGSRVVRVIA